MSIQGIHQATSPNHFSPQNSVMPRSQSEDTNSIQAEPDKAAEVCIASTDKVDGEIERLKAKEAQLSEQLGASDNPAKKGDLERQLAEIQNELRQKDNDTYRRQNTQFTSGIDLQV